ncbi:TcfC E-set like domain-containing protein [Aeromonas veronii]
MPLFSFISLAKDTDIVPISVANIHGERFDEVYAQQYLASGIALSKSVYASQVSQEETKVSLEIPAVAEGIFYGRLNRSSFKLSNRDDFVQFLRLNSIKNPEKIADRLSSGMESDPDCIGFRSECIIRTEEFSIVIDFYQKRVRLFVNAEWIDSLQSKGEYLSIHGENVIKNTMSFFYNKNPTYDNYLFKNEGNAGFGNGFFYYNFDMQNGLNKLNDANYNWYYENKKVQVGRTGYGQYFNYAHSKSFFADDLFQGVILGTSEELSLAKSDKSYSFFTPVPSMITITRDGKEILKRYVSAGVNKINYQDLPRGAYQAEILIQDDSGGTIHDVTTLIFNDSADFGDEIEIYANFGEAKDERKKAYGVGISIPLAENLVAYGSFDGIDEKEIISIGSEYRRDWFSFSPVYSKGAGVERKKISVSAGGFNAQFLEENGNVNSIEQREDEISRSINVGYNHVIGDTNILTYTYANNYSSSYGRNESYGVRYSAPIYNNMYFTTGYDRRGQDDIFTIGLSVQLGMRVGTSLHSSYSNEKWASRLSLSHNGNVTKSVSYNLDASVDQENNRSINSGINYTGSAFNSIFRTSLYENDGSRSIGYGAQFNSTQVLSTNSINLINPMKSYGDSFIILDNEVLKNVSMNYKSLSNGRLVFIEPDNNVIPVSSFDRYIVSGKMNSGDYVFSDELDKYKKTSDLIPGKAIRVTASAKKVSQNFIYVDAFESELKCVGDACIALDKLDRNLYKLRAFNEGVVTLEYAGGKCMDLSEEFRSSNLGKLSEVSCENR